MYDKTKLSCLIGSIESKHPRIFVYYSSDDIRVNNYFDASADFRIGDKIIVVNIVQQADRVERTEKSYVLDFINGGWKAYLMTDGQGGNVDTNTLMETMKSSFINSDAALYRLDGLSKAFTSSNAFLAKVYNEEKMPTKDAYTLLSLGWTYGDSENEPSLLAVNLKTGVMYYYHGNQENCTPDAWHEITLDGVSENDNSGYGVHADYGMHYGIVEMPYGQIRLGAGKRIYLPGGIKLEVPGADSYITLSSPQTFDYDGTEDFTLFLARNPSGTGTTLLPVTRVTWSIHKPDDHGQTGYDAWWNPEHGLWQIRSNDTGNVFRDIVGGPFLDARVNGDMITRVDCLGYRLWNNQPEIPPLPTDEGSWILKCVVDSTNTPMVQWVKE